MVIIMSKINILIEDLCPNGVQFKTLADLCDLKRGQSTILEKLNSGIYPVIAGGLKPSFYCDVYNRPSGTVVVAGSGAYAGFVTFWERPVFVTDAFSVISKGEVLNKYIFFYLKSKQELIHSLKKGGGVPHVYTSTISNFLVPVPPFEVQQEIVRILDNFTELIAELTAELTARKQQYQYYRDNLLEFKTTITRRFGDIAKISRGASPRPIQNFVTQDKNGVSWIKIGDVLPNNKYITETNEKITQEGARKSKYVKIGDFILSNSMSFGRPYIMKINGCIHDGWLSISDFENTYTPDFLYHLISSNKIQIMMSQKASNGTVQNLNAEIVKSLELPTPPLEEQQRIVDILDKFDKLVNDVSEGIPAEIAARKKQYEYYRDKLLTFKEVGNESI